MAYLKEGEYFTQHTQSPCTCGEEEGGEEEGKGKEEEKGEEEGKGEEGEKGKEYYAILILIDSTMYDMLATEAHQSTVNML